MRSLTLLAFGAILLTFAAGCSRDLPVDVHGDEVKEWVVNPTYDGKVAAVGVARRSFGGSGQQLDNATMIATKNLAFYLESRVKALADRYFAEGGLIDGDVTNPDHTEAAATFTREVSTIYSYQNLKGVSRDRLWYHPTTHEAFVRVSMNPEAVENFKTDIKRASHRAFMTAKVLAEEQLDRLDQLVDKEFEKEPNLIVKEVPVPQSQPN